MRVAVGVLWNDKDKFERMIRHSEGLWTQGVTLYHLYSPQSASIGLNELLKEMEGDGQTLAVVTHQDVYFPAGWFARLEIVLGGLPKDWFVAGVWGVRREGKHTVHYGRIAEKRFLNRDDKFLVVGTKSLPARVRALDECCLIFKLNKGFRFDETLPGFDLYGSEICMWAEANKMTAWVVDNFVIHNSMRPYEFVPNEVFKSKLLQLETKYKATVLSTVL